MLVTLNFLQPGNAALGTKTWVSSSRRCLFNFENIGSGDGLDLRVLGALGRDPGGGGGGPLGVGEGLGADSVSVRVDTGRVSGGGLALDCGRSLRRGHGAAAVVLSHVGVAVDHLGCLDGGHLSFGRRYGSCVFDDGLSTDLCLVATPGITLEGSDVGGVLNAESISGRVIQFTLRNHNKMKIKYMMKRRKRENVLVG